MSARGLGGDRGSVVAEFAVALPAVIVVVLFSVAALTASAQQVRLQDAAADAARLAARGEPTGRVEGTVAAAVKVDEPEPNAFRKFFKNLGFE